MPKAKILIAFLIISVISSANAQPFPNRRLSSKLQVGTYFKYKLILPSAPEVEMNLTIIEILPETTAKLTSFGMVGLPSPFYVDVTQVGQYNQFLIAEGLGVGDPVFKTDEVSATSYSITEVTSKSILGHTREVCIAYAVIGSYSLTITYDRTIGFMVEYVFDTGGYGTMTMTLYQTNVSWEENQIDWISWLLNIFANIGNFVNRLLGTSYDPVLICEVLIIVLICIIVLGFLFLKHKPRHPPHAPSPPPWI